MRPLQPKGGEAVFFPSFPAHNFDLGLLAGTMVAVATALAVPVGTRRGIRWSAIRQHLSGDPQTLDVHVNIEATI